MTTQFFTLCKVTKVEDLLPHEQKLITIDSGATLADAFHDLAVNNIYSAPVINKNTGEYSGFLDMLDIVSLIVKIVDENAPKTDDPRDKLYSTLQQLDKFDNEHAERVVNFSKRNPMCPIQKDKSVEDALALFRTSGCNRIPVVHNEKIIGVLTLSTVVSWLHKHMNTLEDVQKKTVRELQVGLKPVVCIDKDAPAIEAFRMMAKHRINAVGILDEGKIFASISSKDIKILEEQYFFSMLDRPAWEFVQEVHKKVTKTTAPVIFCTLKSTFAEVIGRIVATHVHRLFIIDEQRKPIGVVSLLDVVDMLFKQKEEEEAQRIAK